MSARMTAVSLFAPLLLGAAGFIAPAAAQGVAIVVPPGKAPTADEAKECIAAHWIGARTSPNVAAPSAITERSAAAAWASWLSVTSGRTQTQLQPEVKQVTDRLTVSLADPAKADARGPILSRCAAFERATAPQPVLIAPETTGEHDQPVEEGGEPADAPLDDAAASIDASPAPN